MRMPEKINSSSCIVPRLYCTGSEAEFLAISSHAPNPLIQSQNNNINDK